MTLKIEIEHSVQAELSRQAAANGRDVEAYAAKLLEEAVQSPAAGTASGQARRKSLVEVCAMVRGLTDDVDFSRNQSVGRRVDLS